MKTCPDKRLQFGCLGVAQAYVEAALASVFGLAGRPEELARAHAQRLVMLAGLEQAVVERPPVVGQRGLMGGVLAGSMVVGGEAGPAPLVLEFVEGVFRVTMLPIKGGEGEDLVRQIGCRDLHASLR